MDLLKPADLPENFTRSLYKIAPYRGCAHGCRYCDGRAERYYVEGDFEKDVVIRKDIPSRLEHDLPLIRERGMVAFGSGTTDPYQPLEATERITGRSAELLASDPPSGLPLPAMVMTKSALALRDLELWRRVNERAGFLLMVSLTSLDEDLRTHMEPGASSFTERLALLKAFKAAGCATGILAMPFLPALSDGEDSIRALYAAAIEAKVDFIMPGGLTLRPGRQKDLYLETLAAYRPDLVDETRKIFMDERTSGWPGAGATKVLMGRIAPIQKESGLPHLLPHAVYARILPHHDALRILVLDMLELYADRGVPTGPLKRSAKAYDAWLLAKRREFRRKRSLPPSWLEEALPEALATGELAPILDNRKLLDFVTAVVTEGARLDYRTLRLG
jgi:DNA repair photolyase